MNEWLQLLVNTAWFLGTIAFCVVVFFAFTWLPLMLAGKWIPHWFRGRK